MGLHAFTPRVASKVYLDRIEAENVALRAAFKALHDLAEDCRGRDRFSDGVHMAKRTVEDELNSLGITINVKESL